jgi:hypothetical protein
MIGEMLVVCEALLGAALLLAWAAVEVIGYVGFVLYLALKRGWIAFAAPPRPKRDVRWGTAVRAAGLSAGRQQPA